jgi:dTDP-4-dehydrorhamnose 3,5-epimerase
MIEGVAFKELKTNVDERGFFREVVRVTDDFFGEGFGQWSHSLMYTHTAKAWHIHAIQIDWWYVPVGVLKVALFDTREGSATHGKLMEFFMGENQPARVVRIPQGVAHGCRCLQGPAHLFYITSKVYNPKDEGRIPHNDAKIGYDWTKLPTIT